MSYSNNKGSIIILGCGFLGKATAQFFLNKNYHVIAVVRSEASHQELLQEGIPEVLTCDVTDNQSLEKISSQLALASSLIYSVSSGKGDAVTYASVYRDGLKNTIDAWKASSGYRLQTIGSRRLIFVSSTSVYAQTGGENVTESSPTEPDRATSRILLEAEAIALAAGGTVARLSGIYGPGRSVMLKKFLKHEARLEGGGHRWINQIHRDDGAQALGHLVTSSAASPGIYNVTDSTPATQLEVYQWIADALRKPLPPDGPIDLNRKRGWTSKRISNKKLRETGWAPKYPSYREALPLLLKNQ